MVCKSLSLILSLISSVYSLEWLVLPYKTLLFPSWMLYIVYTFCLEDFTPLHHSGCFIPFETVNFPTSINPKLTILFTLQTLSPPKLYMYFWPVATLK